MFVHRLLFGLSAVYDGVLALMFILFGPALFRFYQVTPPNHWGYILFPGLMLFIFSVMFFQIAREPVKNRNLIPYGIMLKAAYCGCVFYYWATSGIPGMWKPFAVYDFIFGILFTVSYVQLGKIKNI